MASDAASTGANIASTMRRRWPGDAVVSVVVIVTVVIRRPIVNVRRRFRPGVFTRDRIAIRPPEFV